MREKVLWMIVSLLLLLSLVWSLLQKESEPKKFPQEQLGNTTIEHFDEAKRIMKKLYADRPYTFYCGCHFNEAGIDFSSCGFKPYKDLKRAQRVEWEHIVPAADFGRAFPAWRQGDPRCRDRRGKAFKGRSCAKLVSVVFNRMESDLYNLVPAIGEVNGMRRDYPVGLLPDSPPIFGQCRTKIARGMIEPREEVRGFIARTYKYMNDSYRGRGIISAKNEKLFEAWDKQYAPNPDEVLRARRIAKIQGNINRFVEGTAKIAQREEPKKRTQHGKP